MYGPAGGKSSADDAATLLPVCPWLISAMRPPFTPKPVQALGGRQLEQDRRFGISLRQICIMKHCVNLVAQLAHPNELGSWSDARSWEVRICLDQG